MRKYVDCRDHPGEDCSLRISGSEQEVAEAAHDHLVRAHGQAPGEALRTQIRRSMQDEDQPAVERPAGQPSETPPLL